MSTAEYDTLAESMLQLDSVRINTQAAYIAIV